MIEKPDCSLCRKVYGDEIPPCIECVPPLKVENILIQKIYNLAYQQIGINNAAVFQIIERYVSGFEKQEYCFDVLQGVSVGISTYMKEREEKLPTIQ